MDGLDDLKFNCTRRHFLSAASLGIGSTALAALLDPSLLAAAPGAQAAAAGVPLLASPHLVPRVKRVIYLFRPAARRSSTCSTTSRACAR